MEGGNGGHFNTGHATDGDVFGVETGSGVVDETVDFAALDTERTVSHGTPSINPRMASLDLNLGGNWGMGIGVPRGPRGIPRALFSPPRRGGEGPSYGSPPAPSFVGGGAMQWNPSGSAPGTWARGSSPIGSPTAGFTGSPLGPSGAAGGGSSRSGGGGSSRSGGRRRGRAPGIVIREPVNAAPPQQYVLDDVEKPTMLPSKAPKKHKELDETKSKKGLAELYEDDYAQKAGIAPAPLSISDELKKEANTLFKRICLKLDALSHFHFAPKPVIEDMSVQANVPALAMEEIAPVAVSDAAMLASEEIFEGKGDVKEEGELTQAERKRRRANKKRKYAASHKEASQVAERLNSMLVNHVDKMLT